MLRFRIASLPPLPFESTEPPQHPACALDDLLPPGRVVLCGPSGCGKSLLLAALGALAHTAGRPVLHIHALDGEPSTAAALALGGSRMRFRHDDAALPITSPVVAVMDHPAQDDAPLSAHEQMRVAATLRAAVDGARPLVTMSDLGHFFRSAYAAPTGRFLEGLPDTATVLAAYDSPGMARDIGHGAMLANAEAFLLFPDVYGRGQSHEHDRCGLTPAEQDLLYGGGDADGIGSGLRHWCLFKHRGGESLVIDFDLDRYPSARRLFSPTMADQARLWRCREDDPVGWLDRYLAG